MAQTRIVAMLVAAVLLTGALSVMSADTAKPADGQVLRHVVLFKFKDGTTPQQVAEVVDAFKALKSKIDVIQDFEYGTDVSVENKAQGFTHCFFVTFKDAQARDAYLPHPDHKAFGALVGPRLDKVLVVDYWTKR
jgi:hypothetical protein